MTTLLLDANKAFRKYTGVQKFHDAGYFGERVTAATGEPFSTITYNPNGLVSDPLKVGNVLGYNHAVQTAADFFQVSPKSKLVIMGNSATICGDGTYKSEFLTSGATTVSKYNITNMYNSFTQDTNPKLTTDLNTYLKNTPNFKMFWVAGNDGSSNYNKILQAQETIGVAAYEWQSSGGYAPAKYSSVSDYVDFITVSGTYVNINATKVTDAGESLHGTSFSAPWLCGMSCLVDDFFIDKTGYPLTRNMMIQFFKDNSLDMGSVGFDTKCGFGAVILPDPSAIDINKYRSNVDMLEKFTDASKVSSWAKDSVEFCLINGYMNGKGTTFDPKGIVTREEFCCIIQRIVNKS